MYNFDKIQELNNDLASEDGAAAKDKVNFLMSLIRQIAVGEAICPDNDTEKIKIIAMFSEMIEDYKTYYL